MRDATMFNSPRRSILALVAVAFVSACASSPAVVEPTQHAGPALYPNETPELRQKINYWSEYYEVPPSLVHRLAIRESTHNPGARNGPYYGLLQILPATARGMGFQGSPSDLLDPDTNLKYAVKYLRGAWLLSDGSPDNAVKWYSRGYYYEAKRRNMLVETGLRKG
jgi:soluble lytic murein transglycosylase-like protein